MIRTILHHNQFICNDCVSVFVSHYFTVPSSAPVRLQGSAVNSTTIQLQWEPPPFANQNGVIRIYCINISVTETESVFQLTSETNLLNISGLHPYYTYTLSVAAVTIGPGPYGAVLTIRIPEDGMNSFLTTTFTSACNHVLHCPTVVPSSAPVRFQGTTVNSTTIQLYWDPPPLADQNGVIRSCLINVTVVETGSFFRNTSETTALNISSLHPYYTYNITVAAVTIGPGPYGAVLTIRMPEDGMDTYISWLMVVCCDSLCYFC